MITLINFADKNFAKSQKRNSLSAKLLGKVDLVIEYSPNDIDIDFFNQNKKILESKRGGGNWLWKPYFILRALKDVAEGDFLIYCDSGAVVMRNLKELTQKLEGSGQSVMLFELPLIESQWTQKSVFKYFDNFSEDLLLSNQIMATFVVFKKNSESLDFVESWLSLCCNENILVKQNDKQSVVYKGHREDQSILSVFAKIRGIKPFSDPSDHGRFPEMYLKLDRLFRLKSKENEFTINKSYFLLVRKANVLKCFVKYFIKLILKAFALSIKLKA